ncbi:MAG: hypothetical protein KKC75_04735 [Nanoarchaeota archaeon]|nr:hypothetical protein [Nanoarchaeota archaeon]MBU1005842.1 hypothetical protein [Nanoarchaeota archaeon]MBU1946114.1 hypothetical protein [Nanoarchaeota archaeon]
MGIFDKLNPFKKKDDFDLGKDFGADLGLGPMDNNFGADMGMPNQQGMGRNPGMDQNMNLGMQDDAGFGNSGRNNPMQPPGQPAPLQQPFGGIPQQQQMADNSRDKFEVVSAKLDSIRYTLESINQRIANLERVAYGEQDNSRKRW